MECGGRCGELLGAYADTNTLRVSVETNIFPRVVPPGAVSVDVLNITLDATGSLEDVRVPFVSLVYVADSQAVEDCGLFDGQAQVGTRQATTIPGGTYSFSGNTVVAGGTSKTLTLRCRVLAGLTNGTTFRWDFQNLFAFGASSFNAIQPTIENGRGPIITVASASDGALAIGIDLLQPTTTILTSGATGNAVFGIHLVETQNIEDLAVRELPLILATSNMSPCAIMKCELFGDGILVGSTHLLCEGESSTNRFVLSGFFVPRGTSKTLVLRCDIAPVGFGLDVYGSFKWGIAEGLADQILVVGTTSNTSIRPRVITGQGPLITVVPSGWSRLNEIRTFVLPFPDSWGSRVIYLTGNGISGASYHIEASRDFRAWFDLELAQAGSSGFFEKLFFLHEFPDSYRFFRLRSVGP